MRENRLQALEQLAHGRDRCAAIRRVDARGLGHDRHLLHHFLRGGALELPNPHQLHEAMPNGEVAASYTETPVLLWG